MDVVHGRLGWRAVWHGLRAIADRLGVGAGGRGPSVAWWRRDSRMATALLLLMATLAAGAVVMSPVPAQAQVSGHHAISWNSEGARWSDVRNLARDYDVVALQEAGTRDPGGTGRFDTGTATGNSWTSPSTTWTVNEYTWEATGGRTVYLYYLQMPAVRNSLAIVSSERVRAPGSGHTDVFFEEPQPWRNSATASPSARPAFGIRLPSDNSVWWTWHAGSRQSDSRANDAENMIGAITGQMNTFGAGTVSTWAILGDFNRNLLHSTDVLQQYLPTTPTLVHAVRSGQPTRGERELDYMITNDMTAGLQASRVAVGGVSDHYAVQFGTTLRAAAGVGQITSRTDPDKCLDLAVPSGGIVDGTRLKLSTCDPSSTTQVWNVNKNGSITVNGTNFCLDNYDFDRDGYTEDGNLITVRGCNGPGAQTWLAMPDGTIRDWATGRCLDTIAPVNPPPPPPGAGGAGMSVRTCTSGATQRFKVPGAPAPTPPSRITPGGDPNKCLQTASKIPDLTDANNLTLTACNLRDNVGYWTIKSDGTVRNAALGTCLYNVGGNFTNSTRISTGSCSPVSGSLQWSYSFGRIVNLWTNKCLDSTPPTLNSIGGRLPANTPGMSLQECNDSASQKWNIVPTAPPATQMSVASDKTNGTFVGEVDPNGTAWVQKGSGSWIQLPYTGVTQIAVATDSTNGPLVAVLANGTAYAYQGTAGGLTSKNNWFTQWAEDVTSIAVATDDTNGALIGVVDNGTAYFKQGGLRSDDWFHDPYGGVTSIVVATDPTNGPVIGIVHNGTASALKGLHSEFVSEWSGGVTSIAVATDPTNGPVIGVVSNGTAVAKKGSLHAGWVTQAADGVTSIAVATDPTNGPLIGVAQNGTVGAKKGSLNAGWVTQAEDVTSMAVATDPTNGPLIGAVAHRNGYINQGSLTNPWLSAVDHTDEVTQSSVADGATGYVYASGNAYVDTPTSTHIKLPYTGVRQIAVASDTGGLLVAVLANGTAYAYRGNASGLTSKSNWVTQWSLGVTSIAVATDPTNGPVIGVVSDGVAYARQGNLGAEWVTETGAGVTSIAVATDKQNGPLIAVLVNGVVSAKQGGVKAADWVTERGPGVTSMAVATDPTNGPVIGVVEDSVAYAKQGNLRAEWVTETGADVTSIAVATDKQNGPLIAVLVNGVVSAKQGGVKAADWVTDWSGGATWIAVATSALTGPLISLLFDYPYYKTGSLRAPWLYALAGLS
ncbi:ricin-type beta-trefoil lectin domain protein [Streptomyces sp. NPDC002668]|uniref:ricin-type beta-trefoil lectin domain protein n=1 Tax=Streptomyces sp. NPDC002668 TaxID=3154422 RepID=UPI00332EC9A0